MSYIIVATFKADLEGVERMAEVKSDIIDTLPEVEEVAMMLIKKMGFECRIEPYDSEPAEPPYGAYAGEE